MSRGLRGTLGSRLVGSISPESIKGIVLPGALIRPAIKSFLVARSNVIQFDIYGENKGSVITLAGINRMKRTSDGGFALGTATQLRKYDADFNLTWSANIGSNVFDIAEDEEGEFLYVAIGSTTVSVRKYTTAGALIDTWNLGAVQRAIALDDDGNIYVGGNRASNIALRKLSPTGTLLGSWDHGSTVLGLAIASDGKIWFAGTRSSNISVRVLNTNGTLAYTRDTGGNINRVICHNDGIYVIGTGTTNIRRYDLWGTPTFNAMHSASLFDMDFDAEGNLFFVGNPEPGTNTAIRVYNSSLSLISTLADTTLGTDNHSIIVDKNE